MTELIFDMGDPRQAQTFPSHGWAENSQGVRILWLPILRVAGTVNSLRVEKGLSELPRRWLEGDAFCETLRRLVLALQKLHHCVSQMAEGPRDSLSLAKPLRKKWLDAQESLALYLDLAYIYLRRIANLIVLTVSPLLFGDYRAPAGRRSPFKDLRKCLDDDREVTKWKPVCTLSAVREVFTRHSTWFDRLVGGGDGKKGARDSLEHRSVRVIVSSHSSDSESRWQTIAHFYSHASDVDHREDLIVTLREILSGLCEFMTQIHRLIGCGDAYDKHDSVVYPGLDDDLTGFWPRI